MTELSGALVTGIKAVGTDASDEKAYVECQFHNGDTSAIIFSPEIAENLCAAFLQATAHLQKKTAMRMRPGEPFISTPITIESAEFVIGKAPDRQDALILSLTTKTGASLNFELSPVALSRVIGTLKALGMTNNPSRQ